jgi:hypothetical protein
MISVGCHGAVPWKFSSPTLQPPLFNVVAGGGSWLQGYSGAFPKMAQRTDFWFASFYSTIRELKLLPLFSPKALGLGYCPLAGAATVD